MQLRIWLLFLTMGLIFLFATAAHAGTYLNSAHGSTTYGVERPSIKAAGFAMANCAHCHEQHASVGGSEPTPVTGVKEYLLFDQSNTDQATNFCFNCHGSGIAYQAGVQGGHVTNRSYSYRAGGWNLSPVTNVKGAFSQSSSHQLSDIVDFAALPARGWKYTAIVHGDPADSNACAVCHDPHVVKGDPANLPNTAKSGAVRPGVITEINSSPINLWGDQAGEMMDPDYTSNYQAPYRAGPGVFEPAGDATANGTNLPDYVTFCTKCHDAVTTVFGTKTLKAIDWSPAGDKHGQANSDYDIRMNLPYIQGAPPVLQPGGYVLSCLDCHEPHGSGNLSLLRGKVNGGVLGAPIQATPPQNYDLLCAQCHIAAGGASNWDDVHHLAAPGDQAFVRAGPCNAVGCHAELNAPVTRINCVNCHFHGSVSGGPAGLPLNIDTNVAPNGRKNF